MKRFHGLLTPLLTLAALLIAGCMETVISTDPRPRTLRVRTFLQTEDEARRLEGVEIRVFELGGTETSVPATQAVASGVTNSEGVAEFVFEVPITGRNYSISGFYNGQIQRIPSILLCTDADVSLLFGEPTSPLECNRLDRSDTIVFTDESGSTELVQNGPSGAGRYLRCWSLSNPPGNRNVAITIPSLPAPFSLEGAYLDGMAVPASAGPITIPPGSTLNICIFASTQTVGSFTETVTFTLACDQNNGRALLTLRANVVAPRCQCPPSTASTVTIDQPGTTPVGDSITFENTVFTNNASCAATVEGAVENEPAGRSEWRVTGPTAFPQRVEPGGTLALRFAYAPKVAGRSETVVQLPMTLEDGTRCTLNVRVTAKACRNTCPTIETASGDAPFSTTVVTDRLIGRQRDGRIMASLLSVQPQLVSSVSQRYTLRLADTACSGLNVTISTAGTDPLDARFFSVSPQSVRLEPGGSASFDVTFTAPDIEEFRTISASRGDTFRLLLRLAGAACEQRMRIDAVVTDCPNSYQIIDLRAYSQQVSTSIPPDNEIYSFGDTSRLVLKGPNGTDGPRPPTSGDIYVEVPNPNAGGPQAPILNLRTARFSGMFKVATGYSEADFVQCLRLQSDFCPQRNGPLTTAPMTGLNPGDVIAFRYSDEVWALIYVRRADNGTNPPSSQSALQFRVVFPLYCN